MATTPYTGSEVELKSNYDLVFSLVNAVSPTTLYHKATSAGGIGAVKAFEFVVCGGETVSVKAGMTPPIDFILR